MKEQLEKLIDAIEGVQDWNGTYVGECITEARRAISLHSQSQSPQRVQLKQLVRSWREESDKLDRLCEQDANAIRNCANDLEAILQTGNVAGVELPEAPPVPRKCCSKSPDGHECPRNAHHGGRHEWSDFSTVVDW